MPLDKEKKLSLLILLFVLLAQTVALWPELSTSAVRDNDAINHFTMTKQMVEAIEHGGNPLDFWSPEGSLGVPMVRTYQPLAHILVAAAYFALGKTVPLMTVLVWARFLAMIVLPLSFYAAMLLLEFPPLTAAAGALLLPMIGGPGPGQLGMEIRSWIGNGVYPQAVATSLLLLAIGLSFQAIRKGRNLAIAGAVLGLTCLAHLMYGWMGALAACLIALMPDPGTPRMARIRRTVALGAVAVVLTAFQLVPLFTDGYLINHPRFELAEKYDSLGAGQVLAYLFSGQIMDHERLPALSLLCLLGAVLLFLRFRKTRKLSAQEWFVALGCVFWVLVFFGRPTWGILLVLLGVSRDFHLHRVLAAVQIFLLMLAAIGLAAMWREVARRWNAVAAGILTAVLMAPMAIERAQFIESHESQGWQCVEAVNKFGPTLDQAISLAIQRGGRVYAGLPNTWAPAFKLGWTPVSAFVTLRLAPTVSYAYNSSVLPTDVMVQFDELKPEQYRLFNIRTVLAPPAAGAPAFLPPVADFGPFRVLDAPGAGYFGVVDVAASAATNRDNFDDINLPWLRSDWLEKNQYIWLDFTGTAPKDLPRLAAGSPIPPAPPAAPLPGSVNNERQTAQVYEADLDVARPAFALFRMTWHFCWKAYIDGHPQPTAMLSPGYLGVAVAPGRHHILCRYEPGNSKLILAAAGVLLTLLLIAAERVLRT